MELCLRMGDEQAKSLLIRINGQNNMDNIVLSVCYRPTSQEVEVGEAFSNNWKKPCACRPWSLEEQHSMTKISQKISRVH